MSPITAQPAPTRRRLVDVVSWLTTPLLPEDYLGLINPLWSSRELRARVEAVIPETRDAATLVLRPGRTWTGHRAGQYVRVGVEINGVRHWRTYSLTSPPERRDGRVTITVKAIPDGLVSNHLVHRTVPGAVLQLAGPAGEFVLPEPIPERLLLLTAGSGVTPAMSMLRSLAAQGSIPDTVVLHSAPTAADVIFGAELRELAATTPGMRLVERHTDLEGMLAVGEIDAIVPDWTARETWACGPAPLLDAASAHWERFEIPGALHIERFRPVTPATTGGVGGTVRFTLTGRDVEADGSTALLDAGEAAGVLMPSGCRMGICHGCVATLRCGQVRDLRTGEVHGDEGDLVQTCVSAAAGDIEIDL